MNQISALENVMLPMEAAGAPFEERHSRATALLDQVGLPDRLSFKPTQLSGGRRQRVAVARAVANGPAVLLADEPTGELHTDDKARVLQLFQALNREGRTAVIVTHDPDAVNGTRHVPHVGQPLWRRGRLLLIVLALLLVTAVVLVLNRSQSTPPPVTAPAAATNRARPGGACASVTRRYAVGWRPPATPSG